MKESMISSISISWYASSYVKNSLNIGWKLLRFTNKKLYYSVISRKVECMTNRDFLNTPFVAQVYNLVWKHIYFIKYFILVQHVI